MLFVCPALNEGDGFGEGRQIKFLNAREKEVVDSKKKDKANLRMP